MKIKYALLALSLLAGVSAFAHDFTATVDGQKLYFEITNKSRKCVAVTYNGNISDHKDQSIAGIVEIPAKVKHNDEVYSVTAISPKAFANADHLKGIVIPSGVTTIGDFAFEDCDSLTNVVFPGNIVTLGQGVFFKATAISNVTIGSDWKKIDLSMFRWSKSLTSIAIPAKIEKIQGVKKLKHLESIAVDPNNAKFASVDGMLYSKDGSIFYACPRAYKGKVTVHQGVTTILPGALIDCPAITALDLPASLQYVSFRETSRMKQLSYILIRGEQPISTSYLGAEGKFLFQIANPATEIVVLSSAKSSYEKALATEAGEYAEKADGLPYIVEQKDLPGKKNIKGVKNFDKY